MKVTILGSGTAIPDGERGPAGFLLSVESTHILVDGGSGSLSKLAGLGVEPRSLDGGVYTHRHLDHTGDLAPLLFAMRVGGRLPEARDYPVWAGEGFREFLSGLEAHYRGRLSTAEWRAQVEELSLKHRDEAQLPGGVMLETSPANHKEGALHLCFSFSGRRVVFSGDTGPSEALVDLATDADLLICECALPREDPEVLHLWPEAVAEILVRARPRRTLITHFYPECDPEGALSLLCATGLRVERAHDLQVVVL